MVTAVGGGTIRDVILDVPVFWSQDISYIVIAFVASVTGFFLFPLLKVSLINKLYLYIDALAIAMFGIQGTEKAWSFGFGLPLAPAILGVITAVGGGVVRDNLLQRPSLLLNKELYAIPVALGCLLHSLFLYFTPEHSYVSALICTSLVVYLRHLSIQKHVTVPAWAVINRGR